MRSEDVGMRDKYAHCMSPVFNGSSAQQHFECGKLVMEYATE